MNYKHFHKTAIAAGSEQTEADRQSHHESPVTRQQIDSHPITTFFTETRSTSTPFEITSAWRDVREFFSRVEPNQAGLTLAQYEDASPEVQREQKNGVGLIPGIVGGDGRRIKENMQALSMIMLDIDDGFPLDEAQQRLRHLEHVIHTTYSHSSEQAKYRIIVPMETPIPPDEGRALFDHLNQLLDGHADVGPGHNPAQLYYTPRCPPDAVALFQFRHNKGRLLDIRDFEIVEGSGGTRVQKLPRESSGCKSRSRVVEGGRNNKIAQIAGERLARGDDLQSAISVCDAANAEFDPPLEPSEARATVYSINATHVRRTDYWLKAAEAALHGVNDLYAWVDKPACIYRFEHRDFVKPAEFKFALGNQSVTHMTAKGPRKIALGNAWLQWAQRRHHRDVTFTPGQPAITKDDCINLWRGYGCKPVAGDIRPWMRLMDLIFGDATEARVYFERWCAYPFRHPGAKNNVAVVLWSARQGVGKTLTFQTVGLLYGPHFRTITAPDLYDKYNGAWVKDTQFVLGEEIVGSDKRAEADWLKHLISGEVIMYKEKYERAMLFANLINFGFTSNHPNAFHVDPNDRRFFVWEVECAPQPPEVFADFVDWRDNRGGREALMHHFLGLDLGDFNPKARPPMTNAKTDMIEATRSELERYLLESVIAEDEVDRKTRSEVVSLEEVGQNFSRQTGNRTSTSAIGVALRKMGYKVVLRVTLSNGKRVMLRAVSR